MNVGAMAGKYVAALPAVYNQLQQAIEDPDSSFSDYEKIILADPALSAKLLKIVNSPFYGFSTRVETISHALGVLGVEQVAELTLGTGVMEGFKGIPSDLIDMQEFWKHSIGCGLASRRIAETIGQPGGEQFYLAGMLHEIGSLVLYKEVPAKMKNLLSYCAPTDNSSFTADLDRKHLYELETDQFGFNHTDLGKALTADWKLPDRFHEAIGFHHHPSKATRFPLFVAVIHVADCLVYEMGLGKSGEPLVPEPNEKCLKLVGLEDKDKERIMKEVTEQVDQAMELYS